MELLKKTWAYGVIAVGAVVYAIGLIQQSRDVQTWGLPSWVWILVGWLITVGIVSLLAFNYWRESKKLKGSLEEERKKVEKQLKQENIEIMKIRASIRGTQASDIPQTLHSMYQLSKEAIKPLSSRKIEPEVFENIILYLFDENKITNIMTVQDMHNRQRMVAATKRIGKRLGLRKPNPQLEAKWRLRVGIVMDEHGIGLQQLKGNQQYQLLTQALEKQRINISATKLDYKIELYLEDMYALNSLRLFIAYSKVNEYKHLFPREFKEFLELLEPAIERRMYSDLALVNSALEGYKIGEGSDE